MTKSTKSHALLPLADIYVE